MDDAKEVKIPLILLVVGLVLYFGYGLAFAGPAGAAVLLMAAGIQLVFGIVVAIPACFLAASLLGTSYGSVGTATLKLAAIIIFPTAASLLIPIFGWLVALMLYWFLIGFLFDLEPMEVIYTALIIWGVRLVATSLLEDFAGAVA